MREETYFISSPDLLSKEERTAQKEWISKYDSIQNKEINFDESNKDSSINIIFMSQIIGNIKSSDLRPLSEIKAEVEDMIDEAFEMGAFE